MAYLLLLGELVYHALWEDLLADSKVDRNSWDKASIEQVLDLLGLSIEDVSHCNGEVKAVLCVQLLDLRESISELSLDSTNDNAVK